MLILVGGRAVIHKDIDVGDYTAFAHAARAPRVADADARLHARARPARPRVVVAARPAPGHQDRHPRRRRRRRSRRRPSPRTSRSKHLTIKIGDRALLDDVSFTLEPGTITAIVGRTGAGKSTLVEALCRMIAVPAGTVFIDGRDVTTMPLASLRAQIGYAPQEAFLFSTTIADNIAMGYGGGTAIPAARARELERVGAPTSAPDLQRRAARHRCGEGRRASRATSRRCPRGSARSSASAASRCRVASASASHSRARSPPQPRLLVLDDSLSSVDAETER